MRTNEVKRGLRSGRVSIGTMVFEFATTGIGRIAARAGAEFVIYDMEHTGWTSETTRMLLATTRSEDVVPIVRVASCRTDLIRTQLDLGAMGVMVPMVASEDEARALVAATKYPPEGERGAAFEIAHDGYAGGDVGEKIASANAETLTIAQIETVAGVDAVDAIAAVEGLDVLWVGQFDLTTSLGTPGRFDDEAFTAAVAKVVDAARRHDKALGVLALSVDEARRWIDMGFTCIAYGGDLWLYRKALAEGLGQLRRP